jgi:hypothetical protein
MSRELYGFMNIYLNNTQLSLPELKALCSTRSQVPLLIQPSVWWYSCDLLLLLFTGFRLNLPIVEYIAS